MCPHVVKCHMWLQVCVGECCFFETVVVGSVVDPIDYVGQVTPNIVLSA